MLVLPRNFYSRESPIVAKELLGKYLVRRIGAYDLVGMIVETEAYLPFIDQAAHSFIGKTLRNTVLFGEAGLSYVYSIHRYFCLNVVCDSLNVPGCVLMRALEPIMGINFMQENRLTKGENLTNGPGRLCQALQINRNLNGLDITDPSSDLFITEGKNITAELITTTTRIGISKARNLPLRFYITNNNYVSKRVPA